MISNTPDSETLQTKKNHSNISIVCLNNKISTFKTSSLHKFIIKFQLNDFLILHISLHDNVFTYVSHKFSSSTIS